MFNRLRCFDEILISGCSIACIQCGQQWDPPSFSTALCILFPAKIIVFSDSRLPIMLKSVLLFRLLPTVSAFPSIHALLSNPWLMDLHASYDIPLVFIWDGLSFFCLSFDCSLPISHHFKLDRPFQFSVNEQ